MRTVAAVDSMSKINAQMQLSKLQVEVENTKITLKSVQRNYESLSSSFQKKERECQKLEALLSSEREVIQTLLQQLEESNGRAVSEAQSAKEDTKTKEELEHKSKELEKAKGEIKRLQKDKAKFDAEGKSLRKKMLEAESKYHVVARNLKASVEDNKLLQENIDKVLQEAESWHKKYKEASAVVDKLESEKENLKGSLDESLKGANKGMEGKDKEIADLKKDVLNLNHQLHDLGESNRVSDARYKSCKIQMDSMELELKAKVGSLNELQDELDSVTAERDSKQKALDYEKGIALENKFKMEQLAAQLEGEKSAMAELLAKKTREDSDLDVLSKRVAELQQLIDDNAKREARSLGLHTEQIKGKDEEISKGLAAQRKLRGEMTECRKEHQDQLKAWLGEFERMSSHVHGLQARIDVLAGESEDAKGLSIVQKFHEISDECLERECDISALVENMESYFSKMQQWSESACMKIENAEILRSNESEESNQRDEVIRNLEEMIAKIQKEREDGEASAREKVDKLAAEVETLKDKLDSTLSQQHKAVNVMNEMMEAERFASKDRISSLQKAMEEMERQFNAEKMASSAMLEKTVGNLKSLHSEAVKKSSKLQSDLDEASYKFLDLSNQNGRISKQIENISEDLGKYSEHLLELNLVAKEDVEDLGNSLSAPTGSPMNLVSQVFALRTKFLKVTQLNQDVASKYKALQMAASA
ncbi:hypothetical protein HOP50_07g48040 [Chloropicon primus]|nr:hypothetical protein HOP50_07g48040 [Chloropicon primus]